MKNNAPAFGSGKSYGLILLTIKFLENNNK
jgi:hypothetical protein